jgi:hypothetical protein
MNSFADRLKGTFETLARPLTPQDCERDARISGAEARLGVRLPGVLRAYYRLAGRFDQFNQAYNKLRRPEDWSIDGGRLVFLDESQGVVSWGVEGFATPDDDPPVYQAENVPGEPVEWIVEHGRCSEFLIVMLHLQAVCGGYNFLGGTDITADSPESILTGWNSAGAINELAAFNRDGAAACIVKGTESAQFFVGARTEREFALIEAELRSAGVELDHF